jgi:chromosome segregation ATPase
MKPNPKLDGTGFIDKILGMIRRIFGSAIRSTMEDVLREPMAELRAGQTRLELRIDNLGARLDGRIDELGTRLGGRIDELGTRLGGRIDELGARLDGRIDGLDKKIDGLGARLDGRIDELGARLGGRIDGLDKKIGELTTQQSRMVEKIADLGGEVAALKRDQKSAEVVERRLTRIEDRLFARAS